MWKWIRRLALFLLALLVLSGVVGHIRAMSETAPYKLVEIAPGRTLHTLCEGPEDAPFVLYDAGAFGIYADGWWIKEDLKKDFRVCLYDRAGMGWSPAPPKGEPPSAHFHVEDMRMLKDALGAPGPIYLIGHSMAGLRLHTWANRYPHELAGLIFIDAARPQSFDLEADPPFWIKLAGPVMSIGTFTARIGLNRALVPLMGDPLDLPTQQANDKKRSAAILSHIAATKAEITAAPLSVEYYRDTKAEAIPTSVFAASRSGGSNAITAIEAEKATGFGRVNPLPDETHVSLLSKPIAKAIAEDLRAMHQHSLRFRSPDE